MIVIGITRVRNEFAVVAVPGSVYLSRELSPATLSCYQIYRQFHMYMLLGYRVVVFCRGDEGRLVNATAIPPLTHHTKHSTRYG